MAETSVAPTIRREIDDSICVLTFDRPESGANIFDAAALSDLDQQLDFIEGEDSLEGVVILSAKKSIFIAGADLKTLLHQAQTGEMRAFIAEGQRIFNRLAALKIPTCAAIHGACADGGYAGERKTSAPRASGNLAPARALEIIRKNLPLDQSLAAELDTIAELGGTDATQNLIRNFFLAEKYKRGSSKQMPEKITHAAVIGAGIMGSGIAQWLSSRRVSVILRDVGTEELTRGLAGIEKIYADAVKRGIMTDEEAKEGRARIVASSAPIEMRDVQIVIEAASEKMEIKKEIFRELVQKAPHATMLATNTSALSLSDLAAETKTPERVVGLHFFNPVSRMKLVEVVVGTETSDATIARALGFVRQIAKLPVIVRDSPGFLVNRVLFPYLLEAAELFENGVSGQEMDHALLQWGMPMGPLRLIDEIGVDITVDIANTLEKAYGQRYRAPKILREMQSAKMLGRKSGRGFYR